MIRQCSVQLQDHRVEKIGNATHTVSYPFIRAQPFALRLLCIRRWFGTSDLPADEYERAVWYGFLPDELTNADPDSMLVTWPQYCRMQANMIATYDETLLPAWVKMNKSAPDAEMKRDGAMGIAAVCGGSPWL